MSQERKAKEVRHIRKLFDGRKTAQEAHREIAYPVDARCAGCRTEKVAGRIRVLMLANELVGRYAQMAMLIAKENEGRIQIVETNKRYGNVKFAVIVQSYFCDFCRASEERLVARHPSNVIVEIETGPPPDRPVFQVPGDGLGKLPS